MIVFIVVSIAVIGLLVAYTVGLYALYKMSKDIHEEKQFNNKK